MCCVLALGLVVLQLVPAGATSRQRRREPQEALVEGAPVPKVAEFTEWQPFLGERAAPAKPSAPAETPVETTPAAAPAPHLVEGSAATPLPPALLVQQALPNCSVVFFHHLEKTAGTTLRSVLQREAQLGLFDFFSFVNRYNKVQFQMVTARLDSLIGAPGGLQGLRLAVEIHIGGGGYEQFIKYTLPDMLLLRAKLRGAGCRCNLVTLLRHPLLQHVSWHHHFVNHRVPLCYWANPHDCQARMSMALACHGGPSIKPLTSDHHTAVQTMWDSFDLVGVTEHFDEFLVLLTDLVGLQAPAYRSQLATAETVAARVAAQRWTARSCASLTHEPPAELLSYIAKRMAESAKSAEDFKRNKGRSDSRGPPGMMDCAGYGPCEVPGFTKAQRTQYTWFERAQCEAVTPTQVLERLCARIATDEPLYLTARTRFDAQMVSMGVALGARVLLLRTAGAELEARATRQQAEDPATLARRATLAGEKPLTLSSRYTMSSGGGVPWTVDERASWYKPHERARYSCSNCSGDVVPEKDLVGCWPLWPQFGPDELRYRCTRHWTSDPGQHRPEAYKRDRAPLPCWQTCWTLLPRGETPLGETPTPQGGVLGGVLGGGGGAKHCTAACPSLPGGEPALAWRRRWDAELAAFNDVAGAGRDVARATQFIRPVHSPAFMWDVY